MVVVDDAVFQTGIFHVDLDAAKGAPEKIMLWTIAAVFLILWLLGFSFSIGGSLIHLLLVVALVVFIINLLRGRRGAA